MKKNLGCDLFNQDQPAIATEELDTWRPKEQSKERELIQWYIKAKHCGCKIQSGPQFGFCRPINDACGPSVCPWVYWR
jgi:hypothetical protein